MNLLFKNPVFSTGRNTTVRRGVKWAVATPSEFGFPVVDTNDQTTADGNTKIIGFADNVTCIVKKFDDIQDYELRNEHDTECRTRNGLFNVMCRTYGGFDGSEIVTLMHFNFKPV